METRRVLRAVSRMVLAATIVWVAALPAMGQSGDVLYLNSNGVPSASLKGGAPSGALANLDSSRNADPGLTLIQSSGGSGESDDTRYQQWSAPTSGLELDGPASLTISATMADFDDVAAGRLVAYLLDCNGSLKSCDLITSGSASGAPWSADGTWETRTISFGDVTYSFSSGRKLVVKIVVDASNSDADMWIAYDAASYPSRFTYTELGSTTTTTAPPTTTTTAPTTTTTTTEPPTTTTTLPGATTTTTQPSTTTTTEPSATTTTQPSVTTTTGPAGTTTTAPGGTTPTTASDGSTTAPSPDPAVEAPVGQDPVDREASTEPEDVALPALPSFDDAGGDGPEESAMLRAVEFVLPERAAQLVVSPLMILGTIADAMFLTGRDVSLPAAGAGVATSMMIIVGPLKRRSDNDDG